MNRRRSVSFVYDIVIATAVVVGLYGLAFVEFQPVQIPGYFLIVGFNMLEATFGSVGTNYDMLFYAYLIGLGVVSGGLGHFLRAWTDDEVPGWRRGVAGALVVTGLLAFSFALLVLVGPSQLTPILIAGVTGLLSLVVAGWVAGLLDRNGIGTPADRG